ncbi:MAG: hypothetical protein GC164_09560 [Phycisphaera sp.]|nr:hypothetical protein [Phycisphaera sp.]
MNDSTPPTDDQIDALLNDTNLQMPDVSHDQAFTGRVLGAWDAARVAQHHAQARRMRFPVAIGLTLAAAIACAVLVSLWGSLFNNTTATPDERARAGGLFVSEVSSVALQPQRLVNRIPLGVPDWNPQTLVDALGLSLPDPDHYFNTQPQPQTPATPDNPKDMTVL